MSEETQKQLAIDTHSDQAELFADRYSVIAENPYKDSFVYSRKRLNEWLDKYIPADGKGLKMADIGCGTGYHLKRYQDVIELLDAGIAVWTTMNVQHFESRADAVRQITTITVHETVPDSMLDLADEIELVDLSPEDLRKRLAEGKVYTPERVEVAANNFFRTGNLTALREMALRLTAEHVDHKLQDYMQLKRIDGEQRPVRITDR